MDFLKNPIVTSMSPLAGLLNGGQTGLGGMGMGGLLSMLMGKGGQGGGGQQGQQPQQGGGMLGMNPNQPMLQAGMGLLGGNWNGGLQGLQSGMQAQRGQQEMDMLRQKFGMGGMQAPFGAPPLPRQPGVPGMPNAFGLY